MGLQKKKNAVTYVKMKEGKFFLKDDVEPYDELAGLITDIGFDMVEFEKGKGKTKVLYVVITDTEEGKSFKVTLNFDSIATTNFIKFLKSADLSEELTIEPSIKEEDGTKKRAIFVKQDGTYLKAFYNKANPNGLPSLKKTKFKGQDKWDNGEMLEFLEKVVENELKPQLRQVVVKKSKPVEQEEAAEEIADDLPF